ncbi:FKBP-type peptidyl-prolyl cis-trans isomerase [Streptomyces sp. NPDC060027]|uniref:FKBP-type peptidyl-prolyl cis-trans isomerase n=1 Tax=Streptomyces sp. NPDC060027 TaxID=3347040 RepID=UPI0036B4C0BC
MYHRLSAGLLISAVVLSASACSGDGDALVGTPTVTGTWGAKPSISVSKGSAAKAFEAKTIIEGHGPELRKGDYVKLQITSTVWGNGHPSVSSYDQGAAGAQVVPIDASARTPALVKGLPGKRVGSRVLLVAPSADAFGGSGGPPSGVKSTDTLLVVVDILQSARIDPKSRIADEQKAPRPGQPTVRDARDGKGPSIAVTPRTPAPKKLEADVLIAGKGQKVATGQTLVVHYTAVTFPDGKTVDSSWRKGKPITVPLGAGMIVKGWEQGLAGKRVGDRVLLTMPSALAYGTQPPQDSAIPKNAPMAFIVDILGAL